MAGHEALICQREVINAYKILDGHLEGKKQLLPQMAELYNI
jgi:hypothetical protein